MAKKKKLPTAPGQIDVNEPFILYYKNEKVQFQNMSEFTQKTKISSAVAQDFLKCPSNAPFKGWSAIKLET